MGIDGINRYRIILGSKSPRRKELLTGLGLVFEVVEIDWQEHYPLGLKGKDIPLYLAGEKANSFIGKIKTGEILITADTIVWFNDRVLDKPRHREDAFQILKAIAGNTHEVITGVCLLSKNQKITFSSSTQVSFSKLSDEEIEYYIDKYEPYDKAGAYGIQEWIGLAACSSIEGSYFNVMGLPSEQLYKELIRFVRSEELFRAKSEYI